MFNDIHHDEQTVGRDDRDLIADNLKRIKESIYGGGEERPASSGRDREG